MNPIKPDCKAIRDRLVDYADGELPAAEARRVSVHLEVCSSCQAELKLLDRSLALAREVWQDSVAEDVHPAVGAAVQLPHQRAGVGGAVALPPRRRSTRVQRWAVPMGAAAAIVALLAGALWLMPHAGPTPQPESSDGVAVALPHDVGVAVALPPPPPASPDGIQRTIAREEAAARLAAAAAILASQPGLEEYQRRAETYIIETYGDTTAGRSLSSHWPAKPPKEPKS